MATTDSAPARPTSSSTQPFALEPVLVERIWGVADLSPWSAAPTGGKPIGEIWLTAENCVAAGGPVAGKSLAELTKEAPEALGDPRHEGFPLLIKLLFPKEKLSVQVHPNDQEAQALGMPRGKTECWYVLSAEPGAQVALGFDQPMGPAEVRAAIEDGTIEDKMRKLPVKAGALVFVDAGTVHAIGPGMVVLETQQYSDTTYRLWDYGRPRELHIEAGSAVSKAETKAGLVAPTPMDGFVRLVSSPYFAVDRFTVGTGAAALEDAAKLQIVIALTEGSHLRAADGQLISLPRGQAVVLPKGSGRYELGGPAGEVIRVLQP